MRVLCSVTGSPSHARAMLPFARALGEAGHRVTVAVAPELAEARVFDEAPVRIEPVLPSMSRMFEQGASIPSSVLGPGADPTTAMREMLPYTFGGPVVTEAAQALDGLCPEPPDLVLRDGTEFGALLFAEHRGVPHLPVPSGASSVISPDMLVEPLRRRREELGFDAGDDPAPLYRYGRLDCMPTEWSMARAGTPAAMAYRQDDQVARNVTIPDWVADLNGERPLVLAALGTALPMMVDRPSRPGMPDPVELLRTVLAGVSELDADVVLVTSGITLDLPESERPAHVHVVDWVAQPLLLQCADLFLAHGGYNGIREAVRAGTPLAILPQFGDQHHNAERVQELGLGRRSDPDPESITATCAAVLADDTVRARARRAQRAMLALPPIEAAVDDLVELVGRRAATPA